MVIRTAVHEDIPAIQALCRTLMAKMEALEPGSYSAACYPDGFLETVLADQNQHIFVAETELGVVGYAYAFYKRTDDLPYLKPQTYVYLYEFSVHPDYRGQGIGHALFDALENWAKELNADYVELMALSANKDALRLYENLGFRNLVKLMRLDLPKTDA